MKKYGLQLRVPLFQQKKTATRPPLPPPHGFQKDDDDDVEREISRQAHKNKALKEVEEQHKKALEEDPSVFDYDGVYDEMKEKVVRPRLQDREERKPKYIHNLMKKAEQRKWEQEIVYERKLVKERSKEDHLYSDKDKFVTSAYKKKLAEQAKWMEEERLRQLREEKEDVTKKSDLSDFYFNLGKNVAFGANESKSRKLELGKLEKESEKDASNRDQPLPEPTAPESSAMTDQTRDETGSREIFESRDSKPITKDILPDTTIQENTSEKQPSVDGPKSNHHKRGEDSVAAARERFLARKRAKEQ
ncbi:codeine O-demethylase-like [Hibiscus syriacus]|uniref:Codeine O-demethylase-like n=1 Tax=Hibiscus syriacus TaxID=106335 RepID=A0A6A2Z5H1_HIBSY|nr:nuclear speckle splicing regulatory protein 1-like [Hibiscus syriacus]KAE8687254.1 codeine O-demethylase-like [Hibiscus syriacus]